MAHLVAGMTRTAHVTADRNSDLTFFPLWPTVQRMKVSQPELCVGLAGRLTRLARHWQGVNEVLPPAFPLVLLAEETHERFEALAASLPGLQNALVDAEVDLKIAWGRYKLRKRGMHRWLMGVHWWLRG